MKQELKEIVGYLPYEVKAYTDIALHFKNGSMITKNSFYTMTLGNLSDILDMYSTEVIKPILRPLSDLNKEMPKESTTYLSYLNLICDLDIDDDLDICTDSLWCNLIELNQLWNFFDFLYQHHFDIHGLIEHNQAIDVNTFEG